MMTINFKICQYFLLCFFCFICALCFDPIIREHTTEISPWVNSIFQIITRFGDAIICIPIALLAFGLYFKKSPRNRFKIILSFVQTMIAMICCSIVVNLGKVMIGRARPKLFDEYGAYYFEPFHIGYDFSSVPSGHTMTYGVLAFCFTFIFPKYRWFFYSTAIIVGLSRIFVGAHYLSDVTLSLIISYVIAYFCMNMNINMFPLLSFLNKVKNKWIS